MPGVNSVLIVILIIAVFFCHLRITALFDLLKQTSKTNSAINKLYDKRLNLFLEGLCRLETKVEKLVDKDTKEFDSAKYK